MPTSDALSKAPDHRDLPPARPLDEAVWQAWVLKGRAQQERGRLAWRKAVKFMSLAGLLSAAAAGVRPDLLPFDVVIRFIVAAGATVLMFRAFASRNYLFGLLFGVLALLYNPVAAMFSFSGEWQRAFVLASAFPFVASLSSREPRLVPNDRH